MKALSGILPFGEHRMHQLLEVLPVGVAVIEKDGRYSYINPIGQQLLGAGEITDLPSEHIAVTYQIYRAGTNYLYPSEQLPSVQALAGEVMKADDLEIRHAGKAIALEMKVIPVFDDSGEVAYAIAVFQDITERKQAEQLLADYNRTLERQVRERTIALEQEIWERKRAEDAAKAAEIALRKANLELERLATLDGLTQVANRRRFDEYLSQEWRRMAREQQPLSLILCDVDCFKSYNDHYGHQAGDACLKSMAGAMRSTLKRPADLLARYGGEEFAIILPTTSVQGAVAVAQAIQKAIKTLHLPHIQSQVSGIVTLSLGVTSIIPTHNLEPEILITTADEALYQAKKQGRDRIVCI